MNMLQVVSKWLKDNDYKGLRDETLECNCNYDDLATHCEGITEYCKPVKEKE